MDRINFLFGAGADSVYGIGAGASFVKPLLSSEYDVERKKLLGTNGTFKLVYPGSTKVFLQTIASFPEKAKEAMDSSVVSQFCDYYENKGTKGTSFEDIKKQSQQWYELFNKDESSLSTDEKKVHDFFLNNAVFFDALDEKFNSLRVSPINNNARRVINAYCTIFILLLNALYEIPESFSWKYSDIFDLLKNEYDKVDYARESYYSVIKDSKLKYDVTTTNYTSVVEKVTGKEVAYLHGKMHWFEDYIHLTVMDCLQPDERKCIEANLSTILPFILIPSGIKPLVCRREVEQFSKFLKQLEDTNYLCVVGYKFNSEDNHINSMICEWLRNPQNKLLYFNFNSELDWNKLLWAAPFSVIDLKLSPSESELASLLGTENDVINLCVDAGNSLEWFRTLVALFEKK